MSENTNSRRKLSPQLVGIGAISTVITVAASLAMPGCTKKDERETAPATGSVSATTATDANSANNAGATAPNSNPTAAAPAATKETVTKLKIEDTKVGKGAEAKNGDTITVHYTGMLTNGTKFDSSLDRGEPFVFKLGEGRVIQGWEQGFKGMKVGGKRRLTIPSSLGYGEAGAGAAIPPNSTLVFDVELLKVDHK